MHTKYKKCTERISGSQAFLMNTETYIMLVQRLKYDNRGARVCHADEC